MTFVKIIMIIMLYSGYVLGQSSREPTLTATDINLVILISLATTTSVICIVILVVCLAVVQKQNKKKQKQKQDEEWQPAVVKAIVNQNKRKQEESNNPPTSHASVRAGVPKVKNVHFVPSFNHVGLPHAPYQPCHYFPPVVCPTLRSGKSISNNSAIFHMLFQFETQFYKII